MVSASSFSAEQQSTTNPMPDYNLSAPGMAPPAGITPDFDNPPNWNAQGWTLLTWMMVVSTGCVVLRGWAKWLHRKACIEDLMLLGAYVGALSNFPFQLVDKVDKTRD